MCGAGMAPRGVSNSVKFGRLSHLFCTEHTEIFDPPYLPTLAQMSPPSASQTGAPSATAADARVDVKPANAVAVSRPELADASVGRANSGRSTLLPRAKVERMVGGGPPERRRRDRRDHGRRQG